MTKWKDQFGNNWQDDFFAPIKLTEVDDNGVPVEHPTGGTWFTHKHWFVAYTWKNENGAFDYAEVVLDTHPALWLKEKRGVYSERKLICALEMSQWEYDEYIKEKQQ